MGFYTTLLRPLLFKQDPERVHDRFIRLGRILSRLPPMQWALSALYSRQDPILEQEVAGMTFRNPVGLAAGFDKDCQLMHLLPSLGFGFEEVGSITALPYGGNKGLRLKRLPQDKAIIVNYGLKNLGARVLKRRLTEGTPYAMPIGVSVAMTNKRYRNDDEAIADWLQGVRALKDAGDYLTINISCPNTHDPRTFIGPARCQELLEAIGDALTFKKPVFLKLGPDLTPSQLDTIIDICRDKEWITGFILTNLIKDRNKVTLKSPKEAYMLQKGGISGPLIHGRALSMVRHLRRRAGERFVIIGCGGIFTAEDAYAYIRAGASLVQLVTGLIYQGPGAIGAINKGLVLLLDRDGFSSVSDAIGSEKQKKRGRR